MTIAERIAQAGIPHPINWDDMGSSAKDLWEERQIRSIDKVEAHRARLAQMIVRGRVGRYMIESNRENTHASARKFGDPYARPVEFEGENAEARAREWADTHSA